MILWWAYIHENGSVNIKRFFDAEDINEANKSGFAVQVTGPFKAANKEEAEKIAHQRFKRSRREICDE